MMLLSVVTSSGVSLFTEAEKQMDYLEKILNDKTEACIWCHNTLLMSANEIHNRISILTHVLNIFYVQTRSLFHSRSPIAHLPSFITKHNLSPPMDGVTGTLA